jgi:hypothetical protein
MSVEDFLTGDEVRAFHDLEQRTYMEHLPWLVRVWRALFGNAKLKPEEIKKIKQKVDREQQEASLRIRKQEADKSKRELAAKKLKEWFGSEMTYRPIFGDKKYLKDVEEACDVLEQELLWIVPGADNKWFLHFDGKKFHEITKERVGVIWKAYVYGLKMSAPFKMDKSLLISA